MHTGVLSLEEIRSYLARAGYSEEAAEPFLLRADADGNGVLDFDEFARRWTEIPSADSAAAEPAGAAASASAAVAATNAADVVAGAVSVAVGAADAPEAEAAVEWAYEQWVGTEPTSAAVGAEAPLSRPPLSAEEAATAESEAKASLAEAGKAKAAAQQRAFVASTRAFIGSVTPTGEAGSRYGRLREVAKARAAVSLAADLEERTEWEAREAAVVSRIAEIEALTERRQRKGGSRADELMRDEAL